MVEFTALFIYATTLHNKKIMILLRFYCIMVTNLILGRYHLTVIERNGYNNVKRRMKNEI